MTRRFPWVQALRALAAASVAYVHIAHDAVAAGRDPSGLIAAISGAMPWVAGVDIFFVISGFVIVHASARLFAQPAGPRRFLLRRLTRILPLYWTLTSLFLLAALLRPGAVHAAFATPDILGSYLFIPWPRPDGTLEPVLGLGWTLNYEMFFYALLTPALLLPRARAVAAAGLLLCVLVAAGRYAGFGFAPLQFWSDPIVLEFVMGMALAQAIAAGWTLPGWLRLILAAAALAWLHTQPETPVLGRPLAFGVPGLLLVTAAVTQRGPERRGTAMRALVALGDASYALYLFHPFVMRGFTLLDAHLGARSEASGLLYVATSLIVAQICALLINRGFERPVTALMRRRGSAGRLSPGVPSSGGSSC
jgi:exopolysaccharide production protein ExoZ